MLIEVANCFKKRKKKDFIESVEIIAEILVTFLVENRGEKDNTLTPRPLALL
jgi:hypothetical protein